MPIGLAQSHRSLILSSPALRKYTTSYVPEQDRIRIIGLTSQGCTVCLWLTQRLVNQLVHHFLTMMRLDQKSMSSEMQCLTPSQEKGHTEVVLTEGFLEYLVTAVDITVSSGQACLNLRGEDAKLSVSLSLSANLLVEWMRVLRHCYVTASWPDACWGQQDNLDESERDARSLSLH